MQNITREPLPVIPFSTSEQFVDLVPGVFTKHIDLSIEGTIDIAGGTTNGTLLAEAMARLITRLRVVSGAREIVRDISGRNMLALARRDVFRALNEAGPVDGSVQTTVFRQKLRIPFARGWLADPWNTVLPPQPARQEFRLFADWNTGLTGVGDDPGSAAFISGGDRAVTFTDGPRLRVIQVYAENGAAPWYSPAYSSIEVDRFSAADSRLQRELRRAAVVDAFLIAARENTLANPTDALINTVTYRGASRRFVDGLQWDLLQDADQEVHPGVDQTVGYAMLQLADGGKLGNAVDLQGITNPLLEFDVNAPTAGTGQITVVFSELESIPGVTQR